MMNKHKQYPEALIQQYVTGSMNDADEYEFESRMLSDDSLMTQVHAAQSIAFGLSELPDDFVAEPASDQVSMLQTKLSSLATMLWNPAPAYGVALASVLLVALMGRGSLSGGQSINELELLNFSTQATRSLTQSGDVIIEPNGKQVGLFIKIKKPIELNTQHYVELVSVDNGELLWTSSIFEVGSLRDRLVVIPKGLPDQSMRVDVWATDTTAKTKKKAAFCHYSEACR